VYRDKANALGQFVLALGPIAGGCFILGHPAFAESSVPVWLLALVSGVFFFTGICTIVKAAPLVLSRSPALALDEAGLTDRTTGRKRVIPWESIREIRLRRDEDAGLSRPFWDNQDRPCPVWVEIDLDAAILGEASIRINLLSLGVKPRTIYLCIRDWVDYTKAQPLDPIVLAPGTSIRPSADVVNRPR
jgi:hypothetical protein